MAQGYSGEDVQRIIARALELESELRGESREQAPGAEALRETRNHGESAMILYFDLDNLKRINDTHGHIAGDEFVVFAPGMTARTAGQLRHRLERRLRKTLPPDWIRTAAAHVSPPLTSRTP